LFSFNLDENSRRAKAGFISLGFTILLTSTIFYSGFYYMRDTDINKGNKELLAQEYKNIVRNEFEKSEKIVQKVDMVNILEDIERLTQATNATLQQVKYSGKNICVEVKALQIETFISLLPPKSTIKKSDKINQTVHYCYETI